MATGALTKDGISLTALYREEIKSIEMTVKEANDFLALFSQKTEDRDVEVDQRSKAFVKGGEFNRPDFQKVDRRDIPLPTPEMYDLGEAITTEAIQRGISSQKIKNEGLESRAAYKRWVQQIVFESLFVKRSGEAGWWDATMSLAPPKYKLNVPTTSHDHYLAFADSGQVTFDRTVDMKQHLAEHGYVEGVVAFANGVSTTGAEKTGGWTTQYTPTPTLAMLQQAGLWEGPVNGTILAPAGVPLIVENWVPPNYFGMFALGTPGKLCRFRETEGAEGKNLVYTTLAGHNLIIGDYRAFGSNTPVHRGGGVVARLNNASWADPTGWEL